MYSVYLLQSVLMYKECLCQWREDIEKVTALKIHTVIMQVTRVREYIPIKAHPEF